MIIKLPNQLVPSLSLSRTTSYPHPSRILLGHSVQSASILEPFNLSLVECMRQLTFPCLAIFGLDSHCQRLANCQFRTHEVDFVIWIDLIVVCWVGESQWKHALFL